MDTNLYEIIRDDLRSIQTDMNAKFLAIDAKIESKAEDDFLALETERQAAAVNIDAIKKKPKELTEVKYEKPVVVEPVLPIDEPIEKEKDK